MVELKNKERLLKIESELHARIACALYLVDVYNKRGAKGKGCKIGEK